MKHSIFLEKAGKHSILYILFFCLIIISACAQLNHLDRAQEAFSKGADIENRRLFSGLGTNAETNIDVSQSIEQEMTNLSPSFFYRQAYAEIQKALENDKALASDDLLGNAMALKALCEWKLQKYGEARLTAENAQQIFQRSEIPSSRDQAVMTALQGFIENDLAFNALGELKKELQQTNKDGSLSFTQVRQLFNEIQNFYRSNIFDPVGDARIEKAIQIIKNARNQVSPNHPIQSYLVMSQLVCIKNWSDAISDTDDFIKILGLGASSTNARQWWNEEANRYVIQKDIFLNELAILLPGGAQHRVYLEWKQILY